MTSQCNARTVIYSDEAQQLILYAKWTTEPMFMDIINRTAQKKKSNAQQKSSTERRKFLIDMLHLWASEILSWRPSSRRTLSFPLISLLPKQYFICSSPLAMSTPTGRKNWLLEGLAAIVRGLSSFPSIVQLSLCILVESVRRTRILQFCAVPDDQSVHYPDVPSVTELASFAAQDTHISTQRLAHSNVFMAHSATRSTGQHHPTQKAESFAIPRIRALQNGENSGQSVVWGSRRNGCGCAKKIENGLYAEIRAPTAIQRRSYRAFMVLVTKGKVGPLGCVSKARTVATNNLSGDSNSRGNSSENTSVAKLVASGLFSLTGSKNELSPSCVADSRPSSDVGPVGWLRKQSGTHRKFHCLDAQLIEAVQ
eukprot:GHVT01019849.1.p1 GENE.GHVT01019849.1~~GHVT01019849.1.p1  ORF type:complete len:368 (+),score=14.40 GHVT01019849.1:1387-2490(+)